MRWQIKTHNSKPISHSIQVANGQVSCGITGIKREAVQIASINATFGYSMILVGCPQAYCWPRDYGSSTDMLLSVLTSRFSYDSNRWTWKEAQAIELTLVHLTLFSLASMQKSTKECVISGEITKWSSVSFQILSHLRKLIDPCSAFLQLSFVACIL